LQLVEMSDIDTFLTYEVVASSEALKAMSAVHTLRVRRVTATSQTFVEWTTDFSSDANVAVIEDRCAPLSFLASCSLLRPNSFQVRTSLCTQEGGRRE
jgi:hypothetical protein